LTKYLKVTCTSPYVGTDSTYYLEVEDDFDPEGKDEEETFKFGAECADEYVEWWTEVVDEEGA
jgi:hypothetical protein